MPRPTKGKAVKAVATIQLASLKARYAVEYNTTESRDCSAGNCAGVCRCSRITSARVKDASGIGPQHMKLVRLATKTTPLKEYKPSRLESYCLQRLMVHHGCYAPENYEISTCGGYYGEEVSDISFSSLHELQMSVRELFMQQSDHEKVMYILNLEYGFIADIVKQTNAVELVEMNLGAIQASAGAMMLKRQHSYLYHLEHDSILGITLDRLLIDGNHRLSYMIGEEGPEHQGWFINLFKTLEGEIGDSALLLGSPC